MAGWLLLLLLWVEGGREGSAGRSRRPQKDVNSGESKRLSNQGIELVEVRSDQIM